MTNTVDFSSSCNTGTVPSPTGSTRGTGTVPSPTSSNGCPPRRYTNLTGTGNPVIGKWTGKKVSKLEENAPLDTFLLLLYNDGQFSCYKNNETTPQACGTYTFSGKEGILNVKGGSNVFADIEYSQFRMTLITYRDVDNVDKTILNLANNAGLRDIFLNVSFSKTT